MEDLFCNSSAPSSQLVIASTNIHKIREIKAILSQFYRFDILSLRDFPDYKPPEESGTSFKENAVLKAVVAAKVLNQWTLADDSGLVVPALGGAPGVFSARYAGEKATDADNRKKLLLNMRHLADQDRTAYFECCVALASPAGEAKTVTATCEGSILQTERGGSGFGYDPLFVKHEYNKTFAELEEATKNRISHRRKALDKILLSLESLTG